VHKFDNPIIMYAADTALDHMAVMDENESPVDVHVTKN
jgi:hypothetical protein